MQPNKPNALTFLHRAMEKFSEHSILENIITLPEPERKQFLNRAHEIEIELAEWYLETLKSIYQRPKTK